MTFREAEELALMGNAKELLLTHFSTTMDDQEIYKSNASDVFKNTIIGYDGYRRTLTYKGDVMGNE